MSRAKTVVYKYAFLSRTIGFIPAELGTLHVALEGRQKMLSCVIHEYT